MDDKESKVMGSEEKRQGLCSRWGRQDCKEKVEGCPHEMKRENDHRSKEKPAINALPESERQKRPNDDTAGSNLRTPGLEKRGGHPWGGEAVGR